LEVICLYNIPIRVKNLINKSGYCSPYKIAKQLKIEIIVTKVPRRAHGFWRRILKRKIIFVDDRLKKEWEINAVICHEIAHIILHPDYKNYCVPGSQIFFADSRKENEADQFAAELLTYSDLDKVYVLDFLRNGWK
jgi:Zn-dependent peptidase ImmA (M78 family)